MNNDPYIYLLSSQQEFEQALQDKVLNRDSLELEGFIHASPKEQLTRVANKHYKNVENLLVLVVDCSKVTPQVKWEPAAGSFYPHIYGSLNTDAIIKNIKIPKSADGSYNINI